MRSLSLLQILAVTIYATGCASTDDPAVVDGDADADADVGNQDSDGSTCVEPVDSDGDTVADRFEGSDDFDGDGLLNVNDTDDDADNVPTYIESGTNGDLCAHPYNTDGDSHPDFLDTDADNDNLSDADEVRRGTDPRDDDSDDDGFPDGVEVNYGSDPLDSASGVKIDDFYVVLPYDDREHKFENLIFGTTIEVADVIFMVDTTGSMGGTIDGVQRGLMEVIIPGIEEQIENVQMGVAEFEDFAYGNYGSPCGGRGKDHAFNLLQQVTSDFEAVEEAVDTLDQPMGCGGDGPESYVEALYQVATGEGIERDGGGEPYAPAVECESVLDEPGARIGGGCFRPGALPVVLMFGDNLFHNGPPDGLFDPYNIPNAEPAPHTWPEAVDALNAIGARMIGLTTGGPGSQEFRHNAQTAEATGTVNRDGEPLTFTYDGGGGGLDETIVDAVEQLAQEVPQDVTTAVQDAVADEVDATRFIKSVTTVGADPPNGVDAQDEHSFYMVTPGTRVEFVVDFYNDLLPHGENPQLFRAVILVLGNGVAELDRREVLIQIPNIHGEVIF